MEARDIYLSHTDKEGHTVIRHHRVWDASLCFSRQDEAARKEGGKAAVDLSTEDDYKAQQKAGKRQ